MTLSEPLHIRPAWQRVAARLQSVARTNGHAIIIQRVVVNADGNPVVWPEPEVIKLEPRPKGACDAVAELLAALTPAQVAELLVLLTQPP